MPETRERSTRERATPATAEDVATASAVHDATRLAALRGTGLLDSAAEPAFDRLTRLAVRLLGVPSAFFSLVDEERDFYKSACGFGEPLASTRELTGPTFCHYAIQSREPLVIPDTAADPRYRDVPTVRTLGVAAYVGIPIVVDGQAIGSLCVIDTVPRAWTASEVELLSELAASAEREIALRAAVHVAELISEQLQQQAAELEQQVEEAQSLSEELQESSIVLEMERHRLADVFARAPSFLAVLRGPAYTFSLVNEAYLDLVGRRDLVGRPAFEALPDLRHQGFEELLERVITTGEPFVGREIPISRQPSPDVPAEQRFLDLVYLPLVEADGERTGVIAHGTDVTAYVHARHEVERLLAESEAARKDADEARAAAEQASRTKAAFLGTMSHEFRTPLNAIGGYAQLLDLEIAGPLNAEQREHLTRLRASNDHMLGLVNDVLDLAKLDAGELTVRTEKGSTAEPVSAAISLTATQAATRGIRLIDDAADCVVPYVGDEQRVRQVLVNLLSNAIKFSEIDAEVRTSCRIVAATPAGARLVGEGPWAVIDVRDSGIGIAPEHQAAVFEPFKQVDERRTRTKGGTGLGLAISRRLTRLMGGDLTLESAPGGGSTFSVWLPAVGDGSGQAGDAERAESAMARRTRATRHGPGHRSQGLAEIGRRLRDELDQILEAWLARLRTDGAFPEVQTMTTAQVEDHTLSFLSNVVQTLVIVEQTGGLESDLLSDSNALQRITCEYHGRQRRRVGWTEQQLAREYAFLAEELASRVRRLTPGGSEDVTLAVGILERVFAHGREAAVRAYRSDPATSAAT